MPLSEEFISAVGVGYVAALSERPRQAAMLLLETPHHDTGRRFEDSQARQRGFYDLGLAVMTGEGRFPAFNVEESAVDILTNDELAQTIADLKATLASVGPGTGEPALADGTNSAQPTVATLLKLAAQRAHFDSDGTLVLPPTVAFRIASGT